VRSTREPASSCVFSYHDDRQRQLLFATLKLVRLSSSEEFLIKRYVLSPTAYRSGASDGTLFQKTRMYLCTPEILLGHLCPELSFVQNMISVEDMLVLLDDFQMREGMNGVLPARDCLHA
jgi:hypothetical protein